MLKHNLCDRPTELSVNSTKRGGVVIPLLILGGSPKAGRDFSFTPYNKIRSGGGGMFESDCIYLSPFSLFFRTTKLYATKLGMLVHHHDPECHVERLGSCFQGQGHSAGSNPEKVTVSSISHYLNLLQPDLV